jgi:hypothetical protein
MNTIPGAFHNPARASSVTAITRRVDGFDRGLALGALSVSHKLSGTRINREPA